MKTIFILRSLEKQGTTIQYKVQKIKLIAKETSRTHIKES